MLSSSTISVENYQAKALAADEAAKQEFRNKVLSYANDFRFALKEASRLLGVSAGFLRKYAQRHKIEFTDPELRSKEEGRAIFKQYEEIRLAKEPKRVEPRKPLVQPNELKIPPQLDLLSKKAHWDRQNKFLERVQELAETMTMKEVSRQVGVSLRFLKNFSYEHDIEFLGSKGRPANDALTPVFIAEEPPCPTLIQFLTRPVPRVSDVDGGQEEEHVQAELCLEVDDVAQCAVLPRDESKTAAANQLSDAESVSGQCPSAAVPCEAGRVVDQATQDLQLDTVEASVEPPMQTVEDPSAPVPAGDVLGVLVTPVVFLGHQNQAASVMKLAWPSLDSFVESGAPQILYSEFVESVGSPNWSALLTSLREHSAFTEVPLDSGIFAPGLFPALPHLENPKPEAVQALQRVISTSVLRTEPSGFLLRAKANMEAVERVQAQIKDLGSNLSAANMLKLADLAEAGRAQVLACKEWFEAEIQTFTVEVHRWRSFFADWQRLADEPQQLKEQAEVQNGQPGYAPPALVSHQLNELRGQLGDATARIQQMEHELDVTKAEILRLRQTLDSRPAPAQLAIPIVDQGKLRRVDRHTGDTSVDVLDFLPMATTDRVVILGSEWESSGVAEIIPYKELLAGSLRRHGVSLH
ncbi:TPA: hypothetical protein ACP32N_003289 [Pseudomonas aeruginosa]